MQKLIDSPEDVSIVVDTDWLNHYESRDQHLVTEIEVKLPLIILVPTSPLGNGLAHELAEYMAAG